jgi:hypothetical protein
MNNRSGAATVGVGALPFATGNPEAASIGRQSTFTPLLYGVVLAIVLTLLLRETGTAVRRAIPDPRERDHDTGNRTGKNRDGQVRGAAGALSQP